MPTSSSATPGQSMIVPGILSRSMIFFTAIAAMMLSGIAGVVALTVPRRAFDDRIVICHARLLRGLRDAVDVGAQRDHRLARPPCGDPRRGNAAKATLHLEAEFLELAGEIARGLQFLEPQLAEAEDRVDHLLRELGHLVDAFDRLGLLRIEFGVLSRCASNAARHQRHDHHHECHSVPTHCSIPPRP